MIQRHVFIKGEVQGVGFRASTFKEARKHPSLRGFVRNLSDGRVEAIFSGDEVDVLALTAWCRQGPPSARVTELEVKEESVDPSLSLFHIL